MSEAERPGLLKLLAGEADFPHHLVDLYKDASDRYVCFLAWHDDQVVGMLSGSFISELSLSGGFHAFELPPPPHAFLDRIHVRATERGRGVGRSLIRAYAEGACQRDCSFIGGSIDLASDSTTRRAFFEQLGFSVRAHDNFGAPIDTVIAAAKSPNSLRPSSADDGKTIGEMKRAATASCAS